MKQTRMIVWEKRDDRKVIYDVIQCSRTRKGNVSPTLTATLQMALDKGMTVEIDEVDA